MCLTAYRSYLYVSCLLLAHLPAIAPVEASTVRGMLVRQAQDKAIPVAGIAVGLVGNGIKSLDTYTGNDGMYYLYKIPPGVYSLEISLHPQSASPLILSITVGNKEFTDIAPITIESTQVSQGYQGLESDLLAILRSVPQRRQYVEPDMDAKKLALARREAHVPTSERVLGFIDTTVDGSGANSIVFGAAGVYYHTEWPRPSGAPSSASISYSQFPVRTFAKVTSSQISLGHGQIFNAGGNVSADQVVTILNAIKSNVTARLAR